MFKKLAVASAISLLLAGCGAEDRDYDVLERAAEEVTVDSLDTESLWLFMPSTGEAPRYAITQRGFFQGTPKLVTLRFDEFNGIYAEEVDRDKLASGTPSRWDTDINKAPVLKIPGEFREYRCALNDFDECTNKEEINRDEDRQWTDATHFVPDYEGIKSLTRDTVDTWFTADNVEETAAPRIVSYEYNPQEGVINVEVERTFIASPEDQYQFGSDLNDLSFKTKFFYSLVKLDKLASKDYQVVHYPGRDQAVYGFFNDAKVLRSATGEAGLQGQTYNLINRFNPNKDSIDYYLSDSYHNAGNEDYLRVTQESIAEINKTLEGTGVPEIRIVNPDSKAGVHTGDLRYNVLNLVTDPVDNGLLGYGPSATNPLTGEIVHAHVNQYAGVIKSATRRTWGNLVMLYNRQEIQRPDEYQPETDEPDTPDTPTVDAETATFAAMLAQDRTEAIDLPSFTESELAQISSSVFSRELKADDSGRVTLPVNSTDLASQALAKDQQRLSKLAEQNAYAEEFMWLSTQSKGLIEGIDYLEGDFFDNSNLDTSASDYADKVNTKLKAWNVLTSAQQELVTKAISAHMFKSTLVHELGHNLGLRHNFMGSVDKANFYQEEELEALGLKKAPAYSSIMDYAGSVFDELPVYGKYDVAALRFGYNREIEAIVPGEEEGETRSEFMSLDELDQELRANHDAYPRGTVEFMRDKLAKEVGEASSATLKAYTFCTDEHTTTSVLCNRFDEGTDIKELTEFRIQRYYDGYETRNKRDGRQNFYQFHQFNYFLSRWAEFDQIRDVVENVEEIDYLFARYLGVSNTNGSVFSQIYANSCPRSGQSTDDLSPTLKNLCDTYDAALIASDFFLDILEQPDMVCELEEISGVPGVPNRLRFATLSDLWRTYGANLSGNRDVPTSCFDAELVAELKEQANDILVRSETRDGRIEASLQANNPYQNSVSSVDLLGVWPDKLLAAQMLVKRDSPNVATENSSLSLIDIDGQVERLYSHLSYLSGNPGSRQKIFVDANGDYVETKERYMPPLGKHIDNAPSYLWPMKRFFGLTGRDDMNYWFDASTPDTPTPYFAALLDNLYVHARAREFGLSDNSQGLRDAISLSEAGPIVDLEGAVSFSWKAKNYVATRRNLLAQAMSSRALYTPERQEMIEKLGKLPYRVRNALTVFRDTRDVHEARLIAVGDRDVLQLFSETSGFARYFVFRNEFKEYSDAETGETCLRLALDDESEEQRLQRKCNKQANLEVTLTQSFDKFEEDQLPAIFELAQIFGEAVASNNNISSYAKHKEVYDYDPEVLRLWSSNKYVEFRRAFQQLPLQSGL